MKASNAQIPRMLSSQLTELAIGRMIGSPDIALNLSQDCDYCGGCHPGGAEQCYDKKNSKPPGRRKRCNRCSGYGHDEKVCPTKIDLPTESVLSQKADVKDVLVAAAAANGGTNSVSGGRMFTFEDMVRVAAYMAQVKDSDASEDVVPALKIHGRKYDQ